MLKDYLSVAQDALRTQKELYHVKERRLALALDEYVRLNDAYKEKSSSHTSCKYSVALRLRHGDQPVENRRALGPCGVPLWILFLPQQEGWGGLTADFSGEPSGPLPDPPLLFGGSRISDTRSRIPDPFCFCSSFCLEAFHSLLSPFLPFQIKASN